MESVELWQWIWKALFVLALVVFAAMSIWVTIGGFRDLKLLVRRLKESEDDPSDG
tara:strand:+ start:1450 stop:1614 length:165 start_codon:yes stop_codon:yes gene_type:complete